jgi:hypothetical protein
MSKGNTFENDFLSLIFNAVTITNLAINASSGPLVDLYVSLHTGDPGEAGTQATSETTYTDYVRVPVVRTAAGWTISTNTVSPTANIDFAECGGGTATITHFAVGVTISGAGKLLYSGTVTPNISVSTGVIPRLTTASTITED